MIDRKNKPTLTEDQMRKMKKSEIHTWLKHQSLAPNRAWFLLTKSELKDVVRAGLYR